jgi:hypothetical protein
LQPTDLGCYGLDHKANALHFSMLQEHARRRLSTINDFPEDPYYTPYEAYEREHKPKNNNNRLGLRDTVLTHDQQACQPNTDRFTAA